MPAPRVFWLSAAVSLLVLAASVSYFLLVVLPKEQRHRDELSSELADKQARDKQALDCADQARRTAQDMGRYNTGFGSGPPPVVTGESNHYNRKLGKCVVDVQTVDKNGTAEFVLDAYEQSNMVWCITRFTPKEALPMHRTCMDSQNKNIEPSEADRQIDGLLRE
jgi:hypothetical protein